MNFILPATHLPLNSAMKLRNSNDHLSDLLTFPLPHVHHALQSLNGHFVADDQKIFLYLITTQFVLILLGSPI